MRRGGAEWGGVGDWRRPKDSTKSFNFYREGNEPRRMSRFGQAVRCQTAKRTDIGSSPLQVALLCPQKLWFMDTVEWLCPHTLTKQ